MSDKKTAKPRAKKQPPTKEQMMKMIQDNKTELEVILKELKEEHDKIRPLNLKRIPELLQETYEDLEEDLEEANAQLEELNKPSS
jgi:hypothetical protein